MPELTPADEGLIHQVPEPLTHTGAAHEHWRESYFFVAHPPHDAGRGGSPDDDVVILTLATYPQHRTMDSYQMGRLGGQHVFAIHQRPWGDDPHAAVAGPVRVDIVEPYRSVRLCVEDTDAAVVALDVTFTARTEPYALRRGTMRWRDEVVWDQSHMFQAGVFNGTYRRDGVTHTMDNWWGQRDHSWGVRDHGRCPMWMWLALQFDDEMLGVWHWEYANGAPVYTDGCAAPALVGGGGDPVPVVRFDHDLHWTNDAGGIDESSNGLGAPGLAGRMTFVFANGRELEVEGEGERAAPYGDRGGGQYLMRLRTSEGRTGTGIIEVTGAHHHRFFPEPRADRLPPG
jgi:hypothetical protein